LRSTQKFDNRTPIIADCLGKLNKTIIAGTDQISCLHLIKVAKVGHLVTLGVGIDILEKTYSVQNTETRHSTILDAPLALGGQ
jgi:hypothetical protein